MSKKKLIRITTVPMALKFLLPGQMNYMQQNGFDVVMISADGKERNDVIDNEKCRHIIVPMTRKITPIQDLICLWKLIKIFRNEKPDIVHSHTPKAGLLGMMAAKICGIKVRIHTIAGLPLMVETGLKLRILKFVERLTNAAASNVWPNSFSLYDYIKEHKLCPPQKLKVISKGSSNGIDIIRFSKENLDVSIVEQVKKTIHYNYQNTYLLSVGRLVKDKGIVELVESFKTINKQHPNIKLLLVGNMEADLDPLPDHILKEIITNQNITHIAWTPFVEYFISVANVFVFPSHREGFPNVLLQAGALGVPIVCSAIAGNIDIIEDNKTGLLFPPGNTEAIINKISFAINNKLTLLKMTELLQQNIKTYYNREQIWSSLLYEYNRLTN